jgi:hypothetical protein
MKLQLSLILLVILRVVHAVINGSNQNVTRFRGTMISTTLTADDFRVLASWKANHIRWQLHGGHQADNAVTFSNRYLFYSALFHTLTLPFCINREETRENKKRDLTGREEKKEERNGMY